MLWDTGTQICQQASTRKRSLLWSLDYQNDTGGRQQVPSYHNSNYKKSFDAKNMYKNKKCGDSIHIEGFQCPTKKFQCKSYHKYGHFTSLCYQKIQASFKHKKLKAHMLQAGAVYACGKSICSNPEDCSSSGESFCVQVKIHQSQAECKKIPTPSHLITNLAYKLKPHQTRNQYLKARLDTCADVNIMPASVYKLVFNDPELKKLAPSTLEIGTYTWYREDCRILSFIWSTWTLRSYKKWLFMLHKRMVVSCYPCTNTTLRKTWSFATQS